MKYDHFVNDVFLPNLTRGEFDFDYIAKAVAFEQGGEKIGKTEKLTVMLGKLRQSLVQQKEVFPKFIHLSMILCVRLFLRDGAARKDFFAQLVALDPYQIVPNDEAVKSFKPIFLAVFPRIEDALGILHDEVFGDKFFVLSEKSQKAAVFWVMYFVWRAYDSQKEIHDLLYRKWVELLHTAIAKNNTEMACFLYFPVFHLYIAFNEDKIGSGVYNAQVEMPLSKYLSELALAENWKSCSGKPVLEQKIKIGFVWHRAVFNSPTKILIALLNCLKLSPSQVCCYFYDCESIEVSPSQVACVDKIKSVGADYCSAVALQTDTNLGLYYSVLGKCKALREKIISDQIDVLVCGSDFIQANFLFSSRTAPFQIFWNHGNNAYDVQGIDLRIITAGRQHHLNRFELAGFNYWGFMVPKDRQSYDPVIDQTLVNKIRSNYPGKIILGAIGRINKFDSKDYLHVVARILQSCPNTVFLACGPGNDNTNQHYINITKFVEEQGLGDRFFCVGEVDGSIYGHVLDLFLNTFPLMCGEALTEFRAKAGVFVSLHHSIATIAVRSNEDLVEPYLSYQQQYDSVSGGLKRMIAFSWDEYVAVAEYLIRNVVNDREKAKEFSKNWPRVGASEYYELQYLMSDECRRQLCGDWLRLLAENMEVQSWEK